MTRGLVVVGLALVATTVTADAQVAVDGPVHVRSFSLPVDPGVSPQSLRVAEDGIIWMSFPAEGVFRAIDLSTGTPGVRVIALERDGAARVPHTFGFSGQDIWTIHREPLSVLRYRKDGSLVQRQTPTRPADGGIRGGWITNLDPDGHFIWQTTSPGGYAPALEEDADELTRRLVGGSGERSVPIWSSDSSGQIRRTLFYQGVANSLRVVLPLPGDPRARSGIRVLPQRYSDDHLWASSSDGSMFALVDRSVPAPGAPAYFSVALISHLGDTIQHYRHPYTPIPVPPAHLEAEVQRVGSQLSDDRRAGEEAARRSLFLPATYSPVSGVRVDREGWVWLRSMIARDESSQTWLVLDPAGRLRSTVNLPGAIAIREVRATRAWGTRSAAGAPLELVIIDVETADR